MDDAFENSHGADHGAGRGVGGGEREELGRQREGGGRRTEPGRRWRAVGGVSIAPGKRKKERRKQEGQTARLSGCWPGEGMVEKSGRSQGGETMSGEENSIYIGTPAVRHSEAKVCERKEGKQGRVLGRIIHPHPESS